MHIQPLHDWNLTPQQAIALQHELAQQLISDRIIDTTAIRFLAGVDVSVQNNRSQAAVVVLSYPSLEIVEIVRAQLPTTYPYIPGLLTFREGPVLIEAFQQLQIVPDVFLFDGMGQIHPRRMGVAAHLGLWLQRPTIGIGKTHFLGEYTEPGSERGAASPLTIHGEQRGVVLRTRSHVKPVYVSVGHLTELQSAVELVLHVTPRFRLPAPIRLAHQAAGQF
jgi:deoxyribonuclease V